MTVRWILRRARRQSVSQRRALWIAAGSFLVLALVSGVTVLGLRATRGWIGTVGQSVHVIAFLRDEMESDQVTQLTDLLSSGYTFAYAAGNDCYDSGGTNTRLLTRATRERVQAEAKLQEAVNLINGLTHRVLSTTTTTQPGGGGLFG